VLLKRKTENKIKIRNIKGGTLRRPIPNTSTTTTEQLNKRHHLISNIRF